MKGRTAVYELMPMSDTIREMVMRGEPTEVIHQQAISAGMLTMRNAGLEKVLLGQVTPDELLRVLFSEGV